MLRYLFFLILIAFAIACLTHLGTKWIKPIISFCKSIEEITLQRFTDWLKSKEFENVKKPAKKAKREHK